MMAGWLLLLAVPGGALPLVMAGEGFGGARLIAALRGLLVLMPVAFVAAVPVAVWGLGVLPPGRWFSQPWFVLRGAAYLAIWTMLAVLFARAPARPRPVMRAIGLVVHLVLVTLAATDWVLAWAPGLGASDIGLLVMAGQCALALAVVVLFAKGPVPEAGTWLMAALLAWGALQFTQFLVVWSADMPGEIAWYQQRGSDAAVAAVSLGVAGVVVPVMAIASGWRQGLRACAALVLLSQAVGAFWLITPSLRGRFAAFWVDGLAVLVVLAVIACVLWLVPAWGVRLRRREVRP
jgi:hypothetical protein